MQIMEVVQSCLTSVCIKAMFTHNLENFSKRNGLKIYRSFLKISVYGSGQICAMALIYKACSEIMSCLLSCIMQSQQRLQMDIQSYMLNHIDMHCTDHAVIDLHIIKLTIYCQSCSNFFFSHCLMKSQHVLCMSLHIIYILI